MIYATHGQEQCAILVILSRQSQRIGLMQSMGIRFTVIRIIILVGPYCLQAYWGCIAFRPIAQAASTGYFGVYSLTTFGFTFNSDFCSSRQPQLKTSQSPRGLESVWNDTGSSIRPELSSCHVLTTSFRITLLPILIRSFGIRCYQHNMIVPERLGKRKPTCILAFTTK
jgi:hypothetical protein